MAAEIFAHPFRRIEPQAMFSTPSTFFFVGAMAAEAMIRKYRSDIAIEV
jgi:hypothetical protein